MTAALRTVDTFGSRSFELRAYQAAAVDALFSYFETSDGNPILALPTGAGKSILIAAFIRRAIEQWPRERFLIVTHVRELLAQDASKIEALVPGVSVGVYSAGLGRKDTGHQITVAGIQSVYRQAHKMGDIAIAMIDECFTGDTLILMGDGSSKPIRDIHPGQSVMSFDEATGCFVPEQVEATRQTTAHDLVRVTLHGGSLDCTANHPFLTTRGWKNAEDLIDGDEVVSCVRSRVPGEVHELGQVLQQTVWSDRPQKELVGSQDRHASEQPGYREKGERAHAQAEPHGMRLNARESVQNAEVDGLVPASKERERNRNDGTTTTTCRNPRVGTGAFDTNKDAKRLGLSVQLQGRSGESTIDGSRGGGRQFALRPEETGARSKEGRISFVARLACVEGTKRISDREPAGSGRVHNLQVRNTSTYILAATGAVVHNCHLVSKSGDTMYQTFIADLRRFCPHVKIVGLTATPWRLDSGPLIKGDNRIFTDIAYSISIKDLIQQGYLAPLVTASTSTRADTSHVKTRGGEYIAGDLERAMNQANITGPALDEVERLCSDRKSWLVFCVGVDHARAVAQDLATRGHRCAVVVGDTPSTERDRAIVDFKAGRLRALVNCQVLTTGVDLPNIDALIVLRPTQSPGLFVQMIGRGLRLSPNKSDCLVLDFTSNTRTHGPVDLIDIDGDGNLHTSPLTDCPECGAETARRMPCQACGYQASKPCPSCFEPVLVGAKECPTCGASMAVAAPREAKHNTQASTASILSDGNSTMSEVVASWRFSKHVKAGKPDSVCVTYEIDKLTVYRQWLCFEHGGYAAQKAAQWWVRHGGLSPAPVRTNEALERRGEVQIPTEIRVQRDGKHWKVT